MHMHIHHHPSGRHHHHHPLPDDVDAFVRCAGRRRGSRGAAFDDADGARGGHHRGRFGPGRVFGPGELKLVLLALIAEEPRHGYELIRTIEELFDGNYAPSPGAVYPTLTLLEEMDYASVEPGDGGKKRYAITAAGRAFLKENQVAVDAATARMEQSARIYTRMAAPLAAREALHNLRHAMRAHPWSPREAKRVIGILKRAADEIVGGIPKD